MIIKGTLLKLKDKVNIIMHNKTGMIINVRHDDHGMEIFTIALKDKDFTSNGLMIARKNELDKIN